jgi:hypothetical protein
MRENIERVEEKKELKTTIKDSMRLGILQK